MLVTTETVDTVLHKMVEDVIAGAILICVFLVVYFWRRR